MLIKLTVPDMAFKGNKIQRKGLVVHLNSGNPNRSDVFVIVSAGVLAFPSLHFRLLRDVRYAPFFTCKTMAKISKKRKKNNEC